MANQLSLAFRTIEIITLQANNPDKNAERNPKRRGIAPIDVDAIDKSPDTNCKKDSPRIGINTIKKENSVTLFLSTPQSKPAEIVDPERDSPGITATACAKPIMNADL